VKLKDLEKRLKSEPTNLGLRVQVAGLMREAGRSLEAVEHYRAVALAYRDQGRTQQAIAVCRSILDIAPEDSACQGLLSMLQQGAPAMPKRPSAVDVIRRQSQPALMPNNPVRAATPTGQRSRAADSSGPTSYPERARSAEPSAPAARPERSAPVTAAPRTVTPTQSPPPQLRSAPVTAPPQRSAPVTAPPQRSAPVTTPPQRSAPVPAPAQRPPVAPAATMRHSPMPAAPEVPSLRAPTNSGVPRPVTNAPPTRPVVMAPRTQPPTAPPVGRSITKDKPLPRPQVLDRADRDSPVPPRPARPSEAPPRRSSLDHTPLPPPMPYHMADRTSQPSKISSGDIDFPDTRPEQRPPGMQGGRRISSLINDRVPHEVDVTAELDTRQRPRIASDELRKITEVPPSGPLDEVLDELDEMATPAPELRGRDSNIATELRDHISPTPRGSDDALTPPPGRRSSGSLPRIGPPKTKSRPSIVSIPPKHDSIPPGVLPPKHDSRPPGMSGNVLGKMRPGPSVPPPPRPAMPKIRRDSDDEMTQPHDKSPYDNDDDD
jgi:hypothetical protein